MTTLLAVAIYGIATLIFLILGCIIVYHLVKFGFMGDATKFMIVIFILVSIVLIITSSVYVVRTDWSSLGGDQNSTSDNIQTKKPILGY